MKAEIENLIDAKHDSLENLNDKIEVVLQKDGAGDEEVFVNQDIEDRPE